MNLKRLLLAVLATFAIIGQPVMAKPASAAHAAPWNATITRTANDSYILGNPAAPLKTVGLFAHPGLASAVEIHGIPVEHAGPV